jgi:diphthamide biosynthesis protein 2
MTTEKRAPPQLMFDDGSRVMTEESLADVVESNSNSITTPSSIRGSTPLDVYYEVDRIANEIVALCRTNTTTNNNNNDDMLRIALQFPDELLSDSPEVCWLLGEKLSSHVTVNVDPLVFCLGDTTVGSCCPDEVAALHLQADVLVHYGHACLSPTGTLPVIYSFGRLDMDVPTAVQCIITKQQQEQQGDDAPCGRKFLLLYQVGYHHAMEDLQTQLSEQGDVLVVAGQLPQPSSSIIGSKDKKLPTTTTSCCGGNAQTKQETCCGGQAEPSSAISVEQPQSTTTTCPPEQEHQKEEEEKPEKRPLIVGGLELPETILSWDQLSDYTVLFIGEPESTSQRQYVNIILLFLSLSSPPQAYWTYSPTSPQSLTTDIPTSLQRQLKRRFFLTQKARDARVFGILVSNLSQQHLIQVVKSLKQRIQDAGKASYSFSVGKINPNKLANFAEIDCFVLVACREHSLLGDDREYHVPVITPLELDIALGNLTWGAQAYSLDCQDVLQYNNNHHDHNVEAGEQESNGDDDEDEDAPYFSLVTGQYVQRTTTSSAAAAPLDLEQLPGKGQMAAYKSEAADFLKQREYQGLATLAGQTEPKPAVAGQRGIASDYSGS